MLYGPIKHEVHDDQMFKNDDILQTIDLVITKLDKSKNPGLFHGHMGICLSLYHISLYYKTEECIDLADSILDKLFHQLEKDSVDVDVENGLSGIAIGIQYLLSKGFVTGNPDEILRQLDDKVFNFYGYSTTKTFNFKNGLIGYGFYFIYRLLNKDLNKLNNRDIIIKKSLIDVINEVYNYVEEKSEIFREPNRFEFLWNLPLTLIFLSNVKKLNIYNQKVDVIINRISPIVLSSYPVAQGNRFTLMVAMKIVTQQMSLGDWESHAKLLGKKTNKLNFINDFGSNQISINNGISGLLLIALWSKNLLIKEDPTLDQAITLLIEKLEASEIFMTISKNDFTEGSLSLYKGLIGVFFVLSLAKLNV